MPGCSETDDIAKYLGMSTKELTRRTTALATTDVVQCREELAKSRGVPSETFVMNWDTPHVHEQFAWAMGHSASVRAHSLHVP